MALEESGQPQGHVGSGLDETCTGAEWGGCGKEQNLTPRIQ